ncbi:hypothetical protein R3P88_003757 [Salmonella enterica]|nr:hypothetical protein [Salmonella enterica subsp. diarizonae]EEB5790347.1 hypothetical protein [Salmonella enterica]EDQ0594584.1 hypothetical protein [Salmonella enterica subsp. diarizonae]EDS9676494.1 hypothetical protein [Salmonella enterica subsp. diarizonae]EDU8194220.1 hypothetical protein [Salmonella enterica subsp. diarizonae]
MAQFFIVDEKKTFENVYQFRPEADDSNNSEIVEDNEDNEDLSLLVPEMPEFLFEETE